MTTEGHKTGAPDRLPPEFEQALTGLLNRYAVDAYCSMPDYLLAAYLRNHLQSLRNMLQTAHARHDLLAFLDFNYGPGGCSTYHPDALDSRTGQGEARTGPRGGGGDG